MLVDDYNRWAAVAKSDTLAQPTGPFDAIYVGGAGNVVVSPEDGVGLTIAAVAGAILKIRGKRVDNTNTTATGLFALYR